ncbi:hypothetical protein DDB_G0286173 [Dictyostelium discoideum AX4]|uniref:RGS domain-containing protein n=1 Tax=Dictyostelium discoideum TaxID=44689 RepID=Q54M81_DICDI|nr:hypothetical protein DDB_G0286173 [Dictyostelium discoideum AX4]EAL64379.1 hypothetical protein DDB_G0286173 [Dictyostelium discoideum AX4]|eukprot:XP_637867.1 hypothetical protein DDB_G0286173 [Dictyostelium discoideum AX4]
MSTRKISTSVSTPSISSFSENSALKNRSLKMDTRSLGKYYTATQKSNKNKLFEVINNKDLRSAFYDFLATQFCVENLLCWEAIEKFKQINGSPSEMYSTAEEIYSLFIRDNSRYEINIYGKQKDRLKETLKHTFIIPEFLENNNNNSNNNNSNNNNSNNSNNSSPSSSENNFGGLTQTISTLNLNTPSSSSNKNHDKNHDKSNNNNNNCTIVQSSTFITNAPIQSDTFPKRKRKIRFRKLISKSNLTNIFSDPNNNNKSASLTNIHSHTSTLPPPPTILQEIIHPPLSPSNTMNFDPEFKNIVNNLSNNNNNNSTTTTTTTNSNNTPNNGSNCVVGSCSDNDSFVVIFGNTIGNRKSGSSYALSGSDSSDGEYEDLFDRNNIKFGIAKCSNLFNDIQDELEQMMIENSLGEFLKSKLFKEKTLYIQQQQQLQQQQQHPNQQLQCIGNISNTLPTITNSTLITSKSNNNDNLNIVN